MKLPMSEFASGLAWRLRRAAGLGAAGALVLTFLAFGAVNAQAQNGTITGQVTDATSGAGMASAQVYLVDTGLGTLSAQNGRYIILNVPAGTYTLRVERLGFATANASVTVSAGATVTQAFEMQPEALGLDEIVVTGTAGAKRRREVGNTLAQIDVGDVEEPVQSVDALLQGRVTGATILQSSAAAGGGAQIRLRGNVSVAQSNQPLLYVDGVRVRSDGFAKNVPPVGYSGRSGNDLASPLNSINPDDIERIEVIKGSAATTLYGTEAASGVIQIFTKRGHTGAARWSASIEQGFARNLAFGPDVSGGLPPSEVGIDGEGTLVSGATPRFMYIDPWLKGNLPKCDILTPTNDGRAQPCDSGLFSDWGAWQQKYSLSVSGGNETLRYFLSGQMENDDGVMPLDNEEKFVVRGNFTFNPMDDLQLSWNTSYTNDAIRNTPAGNNAHGLTLNAYRRDRNYLNDESFEAIDLFVRNVDGTDAQEITTDIDHLITGLTAIYTPRDNVTNRLTIGYDLAQQENRNLRPFGFSRAPTGILSDQRTRFSNLTFDYVGTLDFGISDDLRSSFSWGAQSITEIVNSTTSYGDNFPGPGDPTVSTAGNTLGFEARERVVTAGFFFQNLFDFKNKYFLTAGLRVDGNSAFGSDLGLQAYPKLSGSWVLSDEDFWPSDNGQVKLRAAWGQSGRAPGAFDAVRTYDAVGWGGSPAFFPLNVGNAELGPELTTEFEFGADAAFLDSRLAVEVTYYNQRTSDALFNVRQIPSSGFLNSQLENVGELKNTGVELGINGSIIQGDNFGWDLGTSIYTNNSEVTKLPDEVPDFGIGGNGWVVRGQPVPVIQGDCIANPDAIADPIVENDCNFGPNLPTLTWGVNTTLHLPNNMSLTARGEYQGGHYMILGAASAALSRSVRWAGCFDAYRIIETQGADALTAAQRGKCVGEFFDGDYVIYPADFFKIRELTFNMPVPEALVPGASSATLTFSGRNIFNWVNEDFPTFDPEMGNNNNPGDVSVRSISEHVPVPSIWTMALRFTF